MTGAGDIWNPALAYFNDVITTIVMSPYFPTNEQAAVTAFQQPGCYGRSARLDYDKDHEYIESEIKDLGIEEMKIRSFRIPYGYYVRTYQDNGAGTNGLWGEDSWEDGMTCADVNPDRVITTVKIKNPYDV